MQILFRIVLVMTLLILFVPRSIGQMGPGAATQVSGVVDTYFAYAFTRPETRDRSFSTQPLRHNEFALNLAMIDVHYGGEGIRGRFAFQTGTYVQSNLAAEPSLLKNVLEASAGIMIAREVWLDAGIIPSHIGFEGIISRDNWNYSRSILADYSPYYQAGVSLSAQLSPNLLVRALVLNGWQNIMETNDSKAVGTQVQFRPHPAILLNWSTFVGNEQPDSVASRLRLFSDFYATIDVSSHTSFAIVFDIGGQKQMASDGYDSWYASSLMARYRLTSDWSVGGRVEYFDDRMGVLVPTGTPENFRTWSASSNVDYSPVPSLLWRVEGRFFNSHDAIYPSRTGLERLDGFVVVSAFVTLQ